MSATDVQHLAQILTRAAGLPGPEKRSRTHWLLRQVSAAAQGRAHPDLPVHAGAWLGVTTEPNQPSSAF